MHKYIQLLQISIPWSIVPDCYYQLIRLNEPFYMFHFHYSQYHMMIPKSYINCDTSSDDTKENQKKKLALKVSGFLGHSSLSVHRRLRIRYLLPAIWVVLAYMRNDNAHTNTHTPHHINTQTYTHTHTHTHTQMHAHLHTHAHKHTHTHAHTYVHTHTHTHARVSKNRFCWVRLDLQWT